MYHRIHYSIIEYALVSSNLFDVIILFNDVENQYDHSPIVLELLIDIHVVHVHGKWHNNMITMFSPLCYSKNKYCRIVF